MNIPPLRRHWSHLVALLAISLLVSCSSSPEEERPDAGLEELEDIEDDIAPNFDEVQARDKANALGAGLSPLLPWPAEQYMVHDDQGSRLDPDGSLLPKAIVPAVLASSGGASRVVPIVTWLKGGFDPATFPDPDDWGATLKDDSSVRVVVLDGEEAPQVWPVLVEIDSTEEEPEKATMLIRPHRPFPPQSQVVVGLRTSLQTAACAQDQGHQDCKDHETLPALKRILDGAPQGRAEQSWMGRGRDAIIAALPAIGPDVDDLAQAFSFTVRSREEIVDPMLQMQEIAAQADSSVYEVEEITYKDGRAEIYGTVEVPWFLDGDDRLVLDEQGQPLVQEKRHTPFMITIPDTVRETRPVVLFGHGFFSAIEEPTWGNLFGGLKRWEMSAITTRFHGFAEVDLPKALLALGGETIEGLAGIIDLQRQSQANFTVVHNLVRDHLAQTITVDFGDGEFHPLDAEQIPYMGISNGGTQGLVMMSTSPVLTRGALIVPGGGWSHMLQRAAQWPSLGRAFARRYNKNVDLQIAMSILQQVFDPVDSLNFVENLIEGRAPGLPQKPEILIVEAVNDAQVANLVTRWVVGATHIPLITPSVADVWGVETIQAPPPDGAPGGVGYEIYDLGVDDNPPGNQAATENDVHDKVRLLDAYREQLGIFLEDGKVIRTCQDLCEFELP